MDEPSPFERAFFRESEGGKTVFFPFGFERRGYELPDEAAKKRAARAASGLIASTIAIGSWVAVRLESLLASGAGGREVLAALAAPGAALLVAFVGYWAWVSRLVESLPESPLVVSREERLREAARQVAPWKVASFGIVFCALSALVIWLQPAAWWMGLLGIALGLAALFWSRALRRVAGSPR